MPKPTAANQYPVSAPYGAGFVWTPVTLPWLTNGSQTAFGGAIDTTSRVSVNPQGTSENGLTVKMPGGTTGTGLTVQGSAAIRDALSLPFVRNGAIPFGSQSPSSQVQSNPYLLAYDTIGQGLLIGRTYRTYDRNTYSVLPVTSGLVMRYVADDLTGADGSAVSTWSDRVAAYVATATSGTSPVLKTNILNGHKVVRFTPGQTAFGVAATVTVGTIFVVTRSNESVFSDYRGLFTAATNGGGLNWDGQNGGSIWESTPTSLYTDSVSTNLTAPNLTAWNIYAGTQSPASIVNFTIGAQTNFAPSRIWNGDIAEIIVFSRILTQTERESVDDYLGYLYGVQPYPAQAALDMAGTLKLGLTSGGTIKTQGGLTFSDVFGSVVFNGSAGITQSGGSLIDNFFTSGGSTRTFRYDSRSFGVCGPCTFEIGGTNISTPSLGIGDAAAGFNVPVGIGTYAPVSQLEVDASAPSKIGQIIKASSGQTADLLDITDSTNAVKARVDKNFVMTAKGFASSVRVVTAVDTATLADSVLLCNGTFTETLPATGWPTGYRLTVKSTGTGTITLTAGGTVTFDGATTMTFATQYKSRVLIFDGVNFQVESGLL